MKNFEFFNIKPFKELHEQMQNHIKGRLWLKILLGLILGLIIGIILSPNVALFNRNTAVTIGNWLALPGNIFLGLIQMIVIPLIFASIIRGITSSEDMEQLKKLGLRIVIYFLFTTTVAISIGILTALIIKPGLFIDAGLANETMQNAAVAKSQQVGNVSIANAPEVIVDILPNNPLNAMVKEEMFQVVLFAIIIGLALVTMPIKNSKPLLDILASIQEVSMTVVRWAMHLAPLAVFGLIAQITMKIGLDALLGLAVYVGTVLIGLLLLLIFYLLLIFFLARSSPWAFLGKIREAQILAFSTSSSAAVMPLSIKIAEEKLNSKTSISQFIIPLGATINMDGTALYQGAATVFLAQAFDVNLTIGGLLLVIVTAVGASIGTPATPGVGMVILAMVLESVGIPAGGIALIIGVDRILDMSRTAINVTGDLTATMVMNRLLGKGKDIQNGNIENYMKG